MSEKTLLQEHHCRECGGQVGFDPATQTLICQTCQATPAPSEVGATEQTGHTRPDCPNCGAEISVAAGTRQATCPFCESTFSVLHENEDCPLVGEIPEDHKQVIPFSVTKEQYQKSMITWLSGEKKTPVDVFDKAAMIRSSEGLYVPYYYCVASYSGKWTASIGYNRTETYTAFVTQTVNGRTTRVPVTRTRTVIDWRPFSAMAKGQVTNVCEASHHVKTCYSKIDNANKKEYLKGIRDSSHGKFEPEAAGADGSLRDMFRNLFSPQNKNKPEEAKAINSKYFASFNVLACEEPVQKAYDKKIINEKIRREIAQTAPGDHMRDFRFHGDILPDYFLVYRPYWMSVYSYKDRICASHCDGMDPNKHYGTRPIDKDKKRKIRLWALPLLLSVIVTMVAALIGGSMDIPVGLTLVSGLVWLFARANILRQGQRKCVENAKPYLENPSRLFSRQSAKSDPTR